MKIRQTTASDIAQVEALLSRSYPAMMSGAYAQDMLSTALPLITKAKPDLLASGTFYLVLEAGAVLGCGGWTFGEPGSGRTSERLAHLRHFAVDPARSGQGIGRLIFEECTRAASEQGVRRFQAFSSLNAEPFYARMGLKRLDIVHIPMREDVAFPAALMEGPVAMPR